MGFTGHHSTVKPSESALLRDAMFWLDPGVWKRALLRARLNVRKCPSACGLLKTDPQVHRK